MSEMLETYSLSSKIKGEEKEYKLKFKVAKGVKVTFTQNGAVNEIDLEYDETASGGEQNKNYNVKGPLNVKFYQHPAAGEGKDGGPRPIKPDPNISIEP